MPYRYKRDRLESNIRSRPDCLSKRRCAVHFLVVHEMLLISAPLKTPLYSMYRCSYSLLQLVGLVSYRWWPVALECAEEVLWWNTIHVGHSFGVVCRRRHVTPALLAVPFEHDTCDDQKECEGKSHSKSDKDDESECEMFFYLYVSSAHSTWWDWK